MHAYMFTKIQIYIYIYSVTIFGKCQRWPGQLASEALIRLLDVFTAIFYFSVFTPEGAQAARTGYLEIGQSKEYPRLGQ